MKRIAKRQYSTCTNS